jgi:hypothetical protein
MNDRSFDRLTRRAARGVSRRASLLALGAAGLAGAFAGARVETANAKHSKNPCKKQTDQCVSVFTPGCAGDPDCLATLDRCCPIIGRCDFNGFFDCVEAA